MSSSGRSSNVGNGVVMQVLGEHLTHLWGYNKTVLTCVTCPKTFVRTKPAQKYCSKTCAKAARSAQNNSPIRVAKMQVYRQTWVNKHRGLSKNVLVDRAEYTKLLSEVALLRSKAGSHD